MKFWDSSAIVPLLVKQDQTGVQLKRLESDRTQVVCWTTHCECFSALARLEREGALSEKSHRTAHTRLLTLSVSWQVVSPVQALQDEAKRVLRTHNLHCADALQLASAILASGKAPSTLTFVSLDERLCVAASREGFLVDE